MALKGDLASVDLAQVFQMLALNQKVGLLSIQAPRTWHALYFEPRGVTLYYNEHTLIDRVLAAMERAGRLLPENVREARDHAAQVGMSVVEALLAGGFLTQDELEEALRTQMEEEIYDLFFWKDARFEFFEGATSFEEREGLVNERFFFSTDSLIMEAARRIDEWSFIQERVPGPLEVYQRTATQRSSDKGKVLKEGDTAVALLELVDAKRNVARLVEVTGMPPFHVYKTLAQLLDHGLIECVPPTDLVGAAQECVSEGRLQDAINLFEKAIAVGQGMPDAHALVARAYEATQEFELAAYHLKCVAEIHARGNDIKAAAQLLRHVIGLLPTDLAARERLVELTVGHRDLKTTDFDPVVEGKVLVDLYLEIGEVERVRSILEKLLRDNPGDLELKKSLINVHTRAGDTKRVVELYESIAKDLVQQMRPIEAIKYLQKILLIDRARKDISERIRSLYELDERVRSRRRSLVFFGLLFAFIAALGAIWFFYEQHARERFERIEVAQELENKNFAAAEHKYQQFQRDYPLTMVSRQADEEIKRIEGQRLAHEATLDAERRAKEERLKKMRAKYKAEFVRYEEMFRAHRLDEALTTLEAVRQGVAEAGEDEDRHWAGRMQVERNVRDLSRLLAEAVGLERSAREKIDRKDWVGARQLLLDLVSRYEITAAARTARLPVNIVSRPPGAEIYREGRPLEVTDPDGMATGVRTPIVILCGHENEERLELRLPGFDNAQISFNARLVAEHECLMTQKPKGVLKFERPVQTVPGVKGRWLAAGLRGGYLGLLAVESGRPLFEMKLPGLLEVVGAPAITADRVVFRTNEGNLSCHLLDSGRQRWHARVQGTMAHDPVAKDGRVVYTDDQNRVHCLDMESGLEIWHAQLSAPISGRPAIESRGIRVTTQGGELLVLDASDGLVQKRTRLETGINTSPWLQDGLVVFGTHEARIVALRDGNRERWAVGIGRVPRDEELFVTDEAVFVVGSDDTLMRLDLLTGTRVAERKLEHRRVQGPFVVDGTVYCVVRQDLGKGREQDCLLALSAKTLEPCWQYRDGRDGGLFPLRLVHDENTLYLTTSDGRVLQFR